MRLVGQLSLCALFLCPALAGANTFDLGPEVLVENGDGVIQVLGYSVPSLADWNGDGLPDLIVGLGSGTATGRIQVHMNSGVTGAPVFDTAPVYAQKAGGEIQYAGSG